MQEAMKRAWFRAAPRSWWLPACCIASLLLHMMAGWGSRFWRKGALPDLPAVAPPQTEVEITLQPETPHAPAAASSRRVRAQPVSKATPRSIAVSPSAKPIAAAAPAKSNTKIVLAVPAPREAPAPKVEVRPAENAPTPTDNRDDSDEEPSGPLPNARIYPLTTPPPILHPRADEWDRATALAENAEPVAPRGVMPSAAPRPFPRSSRDAEETGNTGVSAAGAATANASVIATGGGNGTHLRGMPFGEGAGNGVGRGSGGTGEDSGGGSGGNGSGGDGGGPVRVVYALDVSSSMSEHDKLGQARMALRTALSELRPDDSFAIIPFADDARPFTRRFVPATPKNIDDAVRRLDAIRLPVVTLTNLSDALKNALRLEGATSIYVLSDGDPTTGEGVDEHGNPDFPGLRLLFQKRNKNRVPLYTYALGDGTRWEGVQLLHEMADDSGGVYRYIDVTAATRPSEAK